jgi:hypothetical protein
MKKYKIQNRRPEIFHACVPLMEVESKTKLIIQKKSFKNHFLSLLMEAEGQEAESIEWFIKKTGFLAVL